MLILVKQVDDYENKNIIYYCDEKYYAREN